MDATISDLGDLEAGIPSDTKQSSVAVDIKHELKNVIHNRRLAKGLEIPATSDKKLTIVKLTKEEEEKRRSRKERNKVAAFKCREKRKLKMERLNLEAEDLTDKNKALATDIRGLQVEKDNLISKLRNHYCVLKANTTRKGDSTCMLQPGRRMKCNTE